MMISCNCTTKTVVLKGCNFENGYSIDTTQIISFYIPFCAQTKHVLSIRAYSISTKYNSEHGVILIVFLNIGVQFVFSTNVCAGIVEGISGALICHLKTDFLETVLQRRFEYVPLAVRHRLWSRLYGAPAHYM
jgi:hypothetical protein